MGAYGTRTFLAWQLKRDLIPHVPVLGRKHQTNGKYDVSHFQYDPGLDGFTYLEGHELTLRNADGATRIKRYRNNATICRAWPIRKACVDAPSRTVTRHMDEEPRETVHELRNTP